ncbi:MAG TPA: Rieske 2Fe-2S domain-containing protein [Chloroflexota bacterium]|nr:Rieske 2Fe-2S domain-containing protein [Chloroflexota bacterium]
MLSKEENELLTRTGAGTPMGDLFRRYWIPALLSEEIPEPDCPPVQVRLMGEELVAFRDSEGRVGLLDEHCHHRGTSLFYGRNEECGLRCVYHGWKYDVDGNVVDTPAEPAGSRFKEKLHHTAYPTREAAGVVFAYMGPPDRMPLFPAYEFTTAPAGSTQATKTLQECNYLQGVEGECDTTHLQYLHWQFEATGHMRDYYRNPMREYVTEETDFGMRLVALRDAGPGRTYVRVSSIVMPMLCWIPAGGTGSVHMYVPAGDDEHSWRFNLDLNVGERNRLMQEQFWTADYHKVRNKANHYLQDRELQRTVNFTGMGSNFVIHDSCATETMGPIYDRSREHLGASDRAVIAVRNYLLRTVRACANGAEPPNLIADAGHDQHGHIDTFSRVIDGTDWRAAFPHLTLTRDAAVAGAGLARAPR